MIKRADSLLIPRNLQQPKLQDTPKPTAKELVKAVRPERPTSSFEQKKPVAGSRLGGTDAVHTESVKSKLAADKVYARLVTEPRTAQALDALKVWDGGGLRALGDTLTRNKLSLAPEKQTLLDGLEKTQPDVFKKIFNGSRAVAGKAAEVLNVGGGGAASRANAVAGAATTPAEAADALHQAQSDYDAAHQRATELDQQLGSELAELDPALTEEQRQAYVQAFHDKYKADYDKDAAASTALAEALTDPLLDQAVAESPALAYAAADAAKALAGGSHSVEVLEWADHAFDPANPAAEAYSKIEQAQIATAADGTAVETHEAINLADDILGPALGGAAGQLVAEHGGDTESALREYESLVAGFKGIAKGAFEAKDGAQLVAAVKKAAEGDFRGLASQFTSTKNGIGIGLGAAAVVFAGFSAGKDAANGDYAKFVQDLAAGGRAGAEILSSALHSGTGAAKLAGVANSVPANFLDRLAPGLGVVANSIQLLQDGSEALDDPSVGHWVQAIGDVVALAGSAVAIALPGVGQLIEGIGLIIAGIGNLFTLNEEKRERDAEQLELLEKAGVDPAAAQALAEGDSQPGMLSESLDMSPEDIQRLAKNHPELFTAPGYTQALIDAAKATGLEGREVNGFIDALAKDDPNYLDAFFALFQSQDPLHPSVHEDVLRQRIDGGDFPTASEYVHEKSPELYGDAAEQAQQADRDYDNSIGFSDPFATVTNLLKSHDDPAYQAEIIQRLQDDGLLENFVTQISTNYHYNDWNVAFLQALEAARDQGVITQDKFDEYAPGLA